MLGWSVPGRAIVLPFAVGEPEGEAEFHIAKNDGCSSLLPIDTREFYHGGLFKRHVPVFFSDVCGKQSATRRVPVVSLRTILGWLGERKVDFLKIDARKSACLDVGIAPHSTPCPCPVL